MSRIYNAVTNEWQDVPAAPMDVDTARKANLFRLLLRRNFPDVLAPETCRALTADAVLSHFAALTAGGTITTQQAADGALLAELFRELSAWTGDGTTWSIDWEAVP